MKIPAGEDEQIGWIDRKFRPVWDGRSAVEQRALGLYFLPHRTVKERVGPTRPRVIKWYCPFADQAVFPSGHRYCINVYTGCSHRCVYCYRVRKIVSPRGHPLPDSMAALLKVYRELSAPGKPVWRGGSWRLPEEVAHGQIVQPFLDLCARRGVRAKFCMENLLGRCEVPSIRGDSCFVRGNSCSKKVIHTNDHETPRIATNGMLRSALAFGVFA